MQIQVLKSKIHRATVTESNLNYIGSITIDETLMIEAGLIPNERVFIYNINNGQRFDTYVIKGKKNSGEICMNGAASRLVQLGDRIIIVSYAILEKEKAEAFSPKVIVVDEMNKIVQNLD